MTAFRTLFFVAVLAGFAVGIVMTGLQAFSTVPLILEAEAFEVAGDATAGHEHHHATTGATTGAEHDGGEAAAGGFGRLLFTALANVVAAVGFALVLAGVSEFAGGIADWRQGLYWGLAGFAAFTLAPGLGLPPELPAMPAAELLPRQLWWISCVAATAAGLALIVFGRSGGLAALGVALLVLPHLVGAPRPDSHESPVPADLHHRFVVAVTVTSLLFWLLLGTAVGLVRPRFAASLGASRPRIA